MRRIPKGVPGAIRFELSSKVQKVLIGHLKSIGKFSVFFALVTVMAELRRNMIPSVSAFLRLGKACFTAFFVLIDDLFV